MGRRRVEEENIRKVQKIKRSYYISLPVTAVRELNWQVGQKLVVEKRGKEIIIRDWEE